MFLDWLFWLPIMLMRHFLQPVVAMAESMSESVANAVADETEAAIKEYAEKHGF